MDNDIRQAIEEIHASPLMVTLAISGAGSQALAWLLSVPGASRTLIEAVVPYDQGALADYLGWQPPQAVSRETAISLAAAAYGHAQHLHRGDAPLAGLSCTAAVATDRPRRGTHRCHLAAWDGLRVFTVSLELVKGARDREAEEEAVSRLLLETLARTCGISTLPALNLLPGEAVQTAGQAVDHPLERLLNREVDKLTFYGPDALVGDEPLSGLAILSGSFNPLHDGHQRLARIAGQRTGRPVMFEMSIKNVDKQPLTAGEITRRLEPFAWNRQRVVLTREPLYSGKAVLLPGSIFVLGYDTAVRLVNPAYYGGDPARMQAALNTVREAGCRFLVAGRLAGEHFHTLADLAIPDGFADLFEGIDERDFRVDLSSTTLRSWARTLPDNRVD